MSTPVEDVAGQGLGRPRLDVRHSELVRVDRYKSECPACKAGLLCMTRSWSDFRLLREDHCGACGQRVRYLDDSIRGEKLPPLGEDA
jgi:hypothetical protein